jgi:hypothetical protein
VRMCRDLGVYGCFTMLSSVFGVQRVPSSAGCAVLRVSVWWNALVLIHFANTICVYNEKSNCCAIFDHTPPYIKQEC